MDSSGVRTQLTVSSITPNTGEFVLAAAPSSAVTLEVKYVYAPVSVSTPHPLVRMATIALSAAYAFSKINVGKPKSVKFGTVTMLRHMESFDHWYRRYEQTIYRINNRMADKVDVDTNNFEPIWGEAYY